MDQKAISLLVLSALISLAYSLDPCLFSPCGPNEICVTSKFDSNSFSCLNEANIKSNVMRARSFTIPIISVLESLSTTTTTTEASETLEESQESPSEVTEPAESAEETTSPETTTVSSEQQQLKLVTYPDDFHKQYLEYDPCLSSPCLFGKVCKSIMTAEPKFICLNEIEATKEVGEARSLYRMIELLYSEGVMNNVRLITSNAENSSDDTASNQTLSRETVTTLKGKNRNTKVLNPCLNNPCRDDLVCVTAENENGYLCVEKSLMTIQQTNSKSRELMKDDTFVKNITAECKKREVIDRLVHPRNENQFIVCLEEGDFTIMDCPGDLKFNQYLDRCDYTTEPLKSGCDSSPCQYGTKCIDLPDFEYKCECPAGFSGRNCENAPDFCASNPCGAQGVCHSLPRDSQLPYYCTCFNNRAFGLTCDEKSEKNPCLNDESESEIFPTKIDNSVFVHCHDEKLHLKFCARPLVFSPDHEGCEWLDLEQRMPLKERLKKL